MINCYQKGRTMIEMLGVLVIIGVLSVGGFDLVSKTMRKRKIGEVKSNVTILAMQSRRFACQYSAEYKTYTKMLYRAKVYPEVLEYDKSKVKYIGSLGEEYKINSVDDEDKKNAFFTIKISKLPDEACIAVASENFGSVETNGFVSVVVNNDQSFTSVMEKCREAGNNEILLKYRACENNAAGLY